MSVVSSNSNVKKPVIEISNLKKSFGIDKVLTGLDLSLFEEENLVVLGKSGSGKSVLIKLIVGLLSSDEGTISVFGNEVTTMKRKELSELRKNIGFLFQSGALYDSMSVRQNLEFPLRRIRKDLSAKEIDEKIKEVLENVGLADSINKMPSELSGGMRKRIGLARTIVVDPLIMLYDEPTTGLDPETSDEISDLILKVQKEYKTASIIITHDIACARIVANRLVMIRDGLVYKEGTLADFENSDDKTIQSFFKSMKQL
jgi:phospholipid/cholesterol/gamma-HCH transport system ATP-binding protein